MGWLCHWTGELKVTWGRDLSLKGGTKSLSDWSLAYTDKQFVFCKPFQKYPWESVNCTCSIKVSVESLEVILRLNVDGQFVNTGNYRGKTGILSTTFATREQYSQKLCDVYVRFQMRRNCLLYNVEGIPQNELTQLQYPWYLSDFHHLFAQRVHNFMEISIVFHMVKLVTWHGRSRSS
jgi:hypothetical protein